jgi:dTDP-4-dehydrorhamnose 3,5-epimerase
MADGTGLHVGRRLPSRNGMELAIPECPKGIGSLIGSADSADLIVGVRIQALSVFPDDRGYFLEVQRMGRGPAAAFPAETSQVSAALNYADAIKAFHFHLEQTDCWTAAMGLLQVALVDLRVASPTFGKRNTIYVGPLRPWQILIPPGIGHGYKVIGGQPAMLIYMTDRFYNPQDEGRIPYDDPGIDYDWETQRK